MANFGFHATFEEVVAILLDMIAHHGVRFIIPDAEEASADAEEASADAELVEHAVIDDDVKARLAKSRSIWLTGPFTPRPMPTQPRGGTPGVMPAPQAFILLHIGSDSRGSLWDSCLECQAPYSRLDTIGLENAFDDLVERAVRPRLIRRDEHGMRFWIGPRADEGRPARSLVFGRTLPRRLGSNMVHVRIGQRDRASEPASHGIVRLSRGTRPDAVIRYERDDATFVVSSEGEGCEEIYLSLLDQVAVEAKSIGVKIVAGDPRIEDFLSIESRFGGVRAPRAPAAPETRRVVISARLARLCRELLLCHPSPLVTDELTASHEGEAVHLTFFPKGNAYGFEQVVRWDIDTDLDWVRRVARGLETNVTVRESRFEPSPDLAFTTVEKIVAGLVLDGAIRLGRFGHVPTLAKAVLPKMIAVAKAPTMLDLERALDEALALMRADPSIAPLREDEIRFALTEPFPDPATPTPTGRPAPRIPALSTYPHADLFFEALRRPLPGLELSMLATGLAGRPFEVRLKGMPYATLLAEVFPFLRSGVDEARRDHITFRLSLQGKEMFIHVPHEAVRATPALWELCARPAATTGARPVAATPRPALQIAYEWERGGATCRAYVHGSGVAWVDESAAGHSVQRVAPPWEPRTVRRMASAIAASDSVPAWVARRMQRLLLDAT